MKNKNHTRKKSPKITRKFKKLRKAQSTDISEWNIWKTLLKTPDKLEEKGKHFIRVFLCVVTVDVINIYHNIICNSKLCKLYTHNTNGSM